MYDVIIPARNEQQTVAQVVIAARRAKGVGKVIVVDDHSSDATAMVARRAGAVVLTSLGKNDKARALATGVAASKAKVLVFFDADVGRVTPRHIEALAEPVRTKYVMCCGLVDYKRLKSALFLRMPPITGMRAIRRELFDAIPEQRLSRYNIEILLNGAAIGTRRRCAIRVLSGMTHRTKFEKRGWMSGLFGNMNMTRQVLPGYCRVLPGYIGYLRRLDILPSQN